MVAATLGIVLGVLLTLLSERAVTHVTPDDPMRGLAVVSVMMGVRFLIALIALVVYYVFAHDGLTVFGISLALSFVTGLMLESARLTRIRTTGTSA
jgi:hypothetical protein